MKLSEAMKRWKGYHTRGRWYTILDNGTVSYLAAVCPLTAAALADRLISESYLRLHRPCPTTMKDRLIDHWPELGWPLIAGGPSLLDMIITKVDVLQMSRDEVAQWLEENGL